MLQRAGFSSPLIQGGPVIGGPVTRRPVHRHPTTGWPVRGGPELALARCREGEAAQTDRAILSGGGDDPAQTVWAKMPT